MLCMLCLHLCHELTITHDVEERGKTDLQLRQASNCSFISSPHIMHFLCLNLMIQHSSAAVWPPEQMGRLYRVTVHPLPPPLPQPPSSSCLWRSRVLGSSCTLSLKDEDKVKPAVLAPNVTAL